MRLKTSRPGFTLLEVILALSVAVLLLGGLYVAVDVQLRHARAGRTVVEQATLARSIFARIDADIAATATLIDPERYRAASSSTSTSGSSGSSMTGSTTTGSTAASSTPSMTSGTSSSSSASNSSSSSSSSSSTTDAITLPLSVQGDTDSVNLYITRVPREALPTDPNATPLVVSDTRRVSWWLAAGGLARQEVSIATSQDALDNLPPGIADEDSYVIASEVTSVQVQYFDGTDWQDSWDCTTPGADGVTPIGPPQAIAIVLEIAHPQDDVKEGDPPTKRYRHVVACLTANGTTPQSAQTQQSGTGGTGQ